MVMMMMMMAFFRLLVGTGIPRERGLLLPQGACGHLSLQRGGDEGEEQVVFELCVTARF